MQWNKLKAVMLKFIGRRTFDIDISINNGSLLKRHQSQTLQIMFGQHFK